MWARVKGGIYKGDLAQVLHENWCWVFICYPTCEMLISFIVYCQVVAVNNTSKKVTVKLIPRIDLQVLAAKFVIYVNSIFSAFSFLLPEVHLLALILSVFLQLLFVQIDTKELKRIHIFCFHSWKIRLETSTTICIDKKLYRHPAFGRSWWLVSKSHLLKSFATLVYIFFQPLGYLFQLWPFNMTCYGNYCTY
jgi:hypothetical protein